MSQLSGPDNTTAELNAAQPEDAVPSRVNDYVTLTKPRITLMVVITAYIGFALAPAETLQWGVLLGGLIGTALSCMAASALNQAFERDTDALMNRTKNRPLPAGRLGVGEATLAGGVLSIAGILTLGLCANWLAAGLSAFTILSYAFLYTPMKRTSILALYIGAVPGAMPPVIGYAAACNSIDTAAWLAFGIMFVWQIPHFLAIAWLYRDDYAKAGLVMLPVIDPEGGRTFNQILVSCMALLPIGLLPTYFGVSGLWYFAAALACGGGFLWFGIALVLAPTRARARNLFLASLVYLPVLLAMLLIDQA